MEEYNRVNNEKKKHYQKYQKYLKKAFWGVLIGVIGLGIPLSFLNQLSDLYWGIGMLVKGLLIGYGFIKTVVNTYRADKTKEVVEQKSDELDSIALNMDKELRLSKEKSEEYEKKLENIKNDYEILKNKVVEIKQEKEVTSTKARAYRPKQYTKTR